MPTINKKPLLLNSANTARKEERQKLYGLTQWKNLRKIYLQSHPLCEECLKNGIVNGDHLQVHHKLSPFDPNISESEKYQRLFGWDNLETICPDCHGKLHAEEQKMKKSQKKLGKK